MYLKSCKRFQIILIIERKQKTMFTPKFYRIKVSVSASNLDEGISAKIKLLILSCSDFLLSDLAMPQLVLTTFNFCFFSYPLHNTDIIIFTRCFLASVKQVASFFMLFSHHICSRGKNELLMNVINGYNVLSISKYVHKNCRKKIRNSKKLKCVNLCRKDIT